MLAGAHAPLNAKVGDTQEKGLGAQAVFDFALTAPSNLTALFNTRAAAAEPWADGLTRTSYERTPRMATYLVAFVIGNLTNVSASVPGQDPFADPRQVSVWGTPDRCGGNPMSRRPGASYTSYT